MFTATKEATALATKDAIDDLIDDLVDRITPTAVDVIDWHCTHQALRVRWDSPMVNMLTWIVGLEPFTADWSQHEAAEPDEPDVDTSGKSVFYINLTTRHDEPELIDL